MQTRSNVLLTLGVLFTIGGATRFLPEALAFAEETPATTTGGGTATEAGTQPAGATVPTEADLPARSDLEEICVSYRTASMLEEDQWLFEAEREEIRKEKIELQAWQNQLQEQTAELRVLQQTLDNRWQEMQAVAGADIEHLAGMYNAMKADQAALIFNQMDAGFAAGFLRLIPSDQAGLILANMEAEKAYLVSLRLASMNDDVRNMASMRN